MIRISRITKTGFILIPFFLVLLALALLLPGTRAAAAGVNSFEFSVRDDGDAVIVAYSGTSELVTIPEKLEGHTVREIGADAFDGYYNIECIYIPESVTAIADNAFEDCPSAVLYGAGGSCAESFAASAEMTFESLENGSHAFLRFESNAIDLRTGSSSRLNVTLFPEYGNEGKITVISSDSSVVRFSDNNVTALRAGKALITARYDELRAECSVNCYIPAQTISAPDSITLGVGENMWLSYTAAPSDADKSRIRISSSSISVVRVSGGRIYAEKEGNAQLRLWYDGKALKVIKVTIKKAPSKVSLSLASVSAGKGETIPIYSYVDEGSVAVRRTYSTDNSSVVEIKRKGWSVSLLAKREGTANITVRTYNGKTAVCRVTVKALPEDISLSKAQITLGAGESYKLHSYIKKDSAAYKRTYYSWDPKIAEIDKNGNVTAVKPGKTTVAVKTANGKKSWCKVTVMAAPKKITLGRSKLTLVVGESYTLYSRTDDKAASLSRTFTISDSEVLAIDKSNRDGRIKALKTGTSKVQVKTFNGKTDTCTVTVLQSSERKKIVDQALKWYRYNEIDGSYRTVLDSYNKGRIPGTYYMSRYDPWCAAYASAVFMEAGMVKMIYPSCSCPTMVRGAISMGTWQENDAYVPERGDLIFYNWDDDGIGDCRTGAYHVGIITNVNSGIMTVIEGNHDDNDKNGDDFVEYRRIRINEKEIRGFITPKYKN